MSLGHRVSKLVADHDEGLTGKAAHWERVRLCEIALVVNGFPFPSNQFSNTEGSPVLRIRDILPGKTGTFFKGPTENAPTAEQGELVVGMDGNFNCRLWPGKKAFLNQRVCKIVPDETHYSRGLLSYALPAYLKLVNDHTSAVTVKHLSSKDLEDMPMPLPPRKEQDRIVSKIDELFSRIDEGERALERVRKLVERYRQSVLKAAVTGELTREWREQHTGELESGEALLTRILEARRQAWEQSELARIESKGKRPNDNSWKSKYKEAVTSSSKGLNTLPQSWTFVSVHQVTQDALIGLDRAASMHSLPGTGHPYIRMNNIDLRGKVDLAGLNEVSASEDEVERFTVHDGDILFNTRNSKELVGKAGLVRQPSAGTLYNNNIMRLRTVAPVSSRYVLMHMCEWGFRSRLELTKKATTSVAAVYAKDLFPLQLAMPSYLEQGFIVSSVEAAIFEVDVLLQGIDEQQLRLETLRRAVLKAAFSGQLVPQDPTDEPASVLLECIAAERAAAPRRAGGKQARPRKAKNKAKA